MSAARHVAAASLASLLAGCALRREDAEPIEMAIIVQFPSQAAAIPVENIELRIFASGGNPTKCAELLAERRSGTDSLGAVVTQRNNICEYFLGNVRVPAPGTDAAGPPVGDVALLAIATLPNGEEIFTGCVQQVLGAGTAAALPITLSRSGRADTVVSAGNCPSLEQLCGAGCAPPS